MDSIEMVNAVTNVVENLGIIGVLVWAIVNERQRANTLSGKILEDWDDMRRDRTKKADEN